MIKAIKFGTPICWDSKGGTVKPWGNCFNGTFSNGKPLSIMINDGVVIRDNACHSQWGYPESVLWIKKDGTYGVDRVLTYTQIEGFEDIKFAIGGLGISNLNPKSEGFCTFTALNNYNQLVETKKFGDVTDYTEHSVFGFKDGIFFASIMKGTPEQIKEKCLAEGYVFVVQGDGRSWASCNTEEFKLNMDRVQYSLVQITDAVNEPIKEPVDKPVETVDKKWRYFKYQEFANTKDGNANETVYELIDKLDEFRKLVGRSIKITSGYRTPAFNASVGGSPNSEHIHGLAADLRFNFKGYTKESIARICKYLGITNCGVYWENGKVNGTINRLHLGIMPNSNGKLKLMDWHTNGKFIAKTYI